MVLHMRLGKMEDRFNFNLRPLLVRPNARAVGLIRPEFIENSQGQLGIAIGDASGKGISGALMMSSLHASLRTITENGGRKVADVVGSVNNLLCRSISSDKFVTFFYSVYLACWLY